MDFRGVRKQQTLVEWNGIYSQQPVKLFSNDRVTKKTLRTEICKAAKKLGVKQIVFSATGKRVLGTYNAFTKVLYLNTRQTKKSLLNTFFHEMGHHYAVKRNLWKTYHFCLLDEMPAIKIFDIENKIDRIANKLWNKHVNTKHWGKYKYVYPKNKMNELINLL